MYVHMFDTLILHVKKKHVAQASTLHLPKYHNSLLPLTAGVSRDICQGVFCQQGDEVLILQITRGLRGELEDQRLRTRVE